MIITGSAGLRRVTRFIGTAAAAALVATSLGAGSAAAAPVAGGALNCAPLVLNDVDGGRTITNWAGIQKDRNNYTDAEVAANERDFQARMAALGFDPDLEDIHDPIMIDTFIHIVREDGTIDGGNIPRTWLRAQMQYLNHSYRGHGHGEPGARSPFHFRLAGVTRTTNADWFLHADESDVELEMKTALRDASSTAETLNVYLTNLINVGLLGYAWLPKHYGTPNGPVLDGVVVESQSLPGGSAEPYDLGGTVAHEVGHWSGLLHTFQGGCNDGDHVEDTPAQASPTTGCPEGADTCSAPGLDPIHNYMDYSYDACYDQFTLGQRQRMLDQWFAYRDGVPIR
jgi:hypothetical protein